MLHIILHILAIIGIIILCIIGLFILLLLLVLLCPISYRIKGSKQVEELYFNMKISYLFHIITARYTYPDPGQMEIRIFGIPLKSKEHSNKHKKSSTKNEEYDNVERDNTEQYTIEQDKKFEQDKIEQEKLVQEKLVQDKLVQEKLVQENLVQDKIKHNKVVNDKNDVKFISHPILWIRRKFQKIYYTIKALYDKIKHIIQNITYYKDVLTDPANQALYRRLKDRILVILKKIIPKHFDAEIVVGTGSPDTTGYLCGIYGMLLPVIGRHVNMTPDFEKAICTGYVNARGHITLMTILIQAIKVYFDKQLWIFIKQLKREE